MTRHQMDVGALTENLSTLRSEMTGAGQKMEDLEKMNTHLQGEKLGKEFIFRQNSLTL